MRALCCIHDVMSVLMFSDLKLRAACRAPERRRSRYNNGGGPVFVRWRWRRRSWREGARPGDTARKGLGIKIPMARTITIRTVMCTSWNCGIACAHC